MPHTVPLSFEPVADGEARAGRLPSACRSAARSASSHTGPLPRSIIEEAIRTAGVRTERRQSAAVALRRRRAGTTPRCAARCARKLKRRNASSTRSARPPSGSTRSRRIGTDCQQAFPRGGAMADRHLRAAPRPTATGAGREALLRDRVGGYCHRTADRVAAPCRRRHADAHAQPDGIPEHPARAASARAAVPAAGRRLPGGRGPRAGHPAQARSRTSPSSSSGCALAFGLAPGHRVAATQAQLAPHLVASTSCAAFVSHPRPPRPVFSADPLVEFEQVAPRCGPRVLDHLHDVLQLVGERRDHRSAGRSGLIGARR